MMPVRSLLSVPVALALVLSLLYLRTAGGQAFTTEAERRWHIQSQQPAISNWQLQDQYGNTFTLADFEQRGVLIDFIFTNCTLVCRAAGSRYAQIQQQTRDYEKPPLLLSISIDPHNDTPEQLLRYQQRYSKQHHDWLVARPLSQLMLATIKRETGITVIPDGIGGYAHTDAFHWMRGQRLLHVFNWTDKDIIAKLL